MLLLKSLCKIITPNICKKATVTFEKAKKPLFCDEYWAQCARNNQLKPSHRESVSLHGELNGINHFFITGANPTYMDSVFSRNGLTPREMIKLTDFEFKKIKPLDEKLTVYRCIGEKPEFFNEFKLYKKRLDIKENDIINMREYAYATSDLSYAQIYMPNHKGILYEIEIPKNAKISQIGLGTQNEIVFPRNSRFQCIKSEKIVNGNENYVKVKLRYLIPENSII